MRRISLLFVLGLMALLIAQLNPSPAAADDGKLCFPDTGISDADGNPLCISGQIRQYWESNGGLPVFGYPITPEYGAEGARNQGFQHQVKGVQWFERAVFELHPQNAAPYHILLMALSENIYDGWYGDDIRAVPRAQPASDDGSFYFNETGHNVPAVFYEYWSSHGLDFGDAGVSARESLALFGFPLTEARMTRNPDTGEVYLTQWFERARFEYHPGSDWPVQLGLLGSEQWR